MSIKGLDEFLAANDIDPDEVVDTPAGYRTQRKLIEAYVMDVLDKIEEWRD